MATDGQEHEPLDGRDGEEAELLAFGWAVSRHSMSWARSQLVIVSKK